MGVKDTTAVPVINKKASINRQTIAPKIASRHGLDVDDHKVLQLYLLHSLLYSFLPTAL